MEFLYDYFGATDVKGNETYRGIVIFARYSLVMGIWIFTLIQIVAPVFIQYFAK